MPSLEAGGSKGQKHLYARYFDESGSGITYRAYCDKIKVKGSVLNIPSRVFEKELTNCGSGRICGKTNWRNSSISMCYGKIDSYEVKLGSGITRAFYPEDAFKYGTTENFKRAPVGKFCLIWENHPNGNFLSYSYEKNKLAGVRSANKTRKELSRLIIVRDPDSKKTVNWNSSSGNAAIIFNDSKEKRVRQIIPTHAACISYEYDKHKKLKEKIFPEGRFLKIEYFTSGKEKGRVS